MTLDDLRILIGFYLLSLMSIQELKGRVQDAVESMIDGFDPRETASEFLPGPDKLIYDRCVNVTKAVDQYAIPMQYGILPDVTERTRELHAALRAAVQ